MEEEYSIKDRLKSYFPSVILIWIAILFYRTNRYYSSWLSLETQLALFWLASAYTVFGIIFFVVFSTRKGRESRGLILIRTLKRLFKEMYNYIHSFTTNLNHPLPKLEHHEKTTILFALVKIFFLPIMLNFFFDNINQVVSDFSSLSSSNFSSFLPFFNNLLFPFIFSILLSLDTIYFVFGYSIESSKLKNVVRSVEPTFFGWIVALICYPPFNDFINRYLGWYADEYTFFWTKQITFFMRILLLILFGIYVWATLALGAKSSNLTNRGIVSRGPYSIVRHPAYISKNLAWWVSIIPILSVSGFIKGAIILGTTATWGFVYYLRAITEERHLIKDPDYQDYCKKVKYRFIPGIY